MGLRFRFWADGFMPTFQSPVEIVAPDRRMTLKSPVHRLGEAEVPQIQNCVSESARQNAPSPFFLGGGEFQVLQTTADVGAN